ncbi:hypothetical protein [Streptomyces pseudogriseolus]|uniref:hypothetical protein n=1 Tax=Streptomyces pseudogriseolus TaxID=36817 RepID=UPI003FA28E57
MTTDKATATSRTTNAAAASATSWVRRPASSPPESAALGHERWQRLLATWAARHVFIHNDGIVDDKYLAKVPNSSARAGRRLVLTEGTCRLAIEGTKALCEALVDVLR